MNDKSNIGLLVEIAILCRTSDEKDLTEVEKQRFRSCINKVGADLQFLPTIRLELDSILGGR